MTLLYLRVSRLVAFLLSRRDYFREWGKGQKEGWGMLKAGLIRVMVSL